MFIRISVSSLIYGLLSRNMLSSGNRIVVEPSILLEKQRRLPQLGIPRGTEDVLRLKQSESVN